jgi:hypothetical protein
MNFLTVFLFDVITRAFAGTYDAQESPLEPGVFITPTHSTEESPPAVGDFEVAVRNIENTAWSVEVDLRGETYYDQTTGLPVVIDFIGTPPANLAATPPPPTTAQLIAIATEEKARLTNLANVQISILTDATDPDIVDDPDPADAALLVLWKKYRQDLRKVIVTALPVVFPTRPALASGTTEGVAQESEI